MSNVNETLEAVRAAQQTPIDDTIRRAFTQSTGLNAYDLEAPSKKLFPVLTPMRNKVPRVRGNGDTATRWRAITGINTANVHPGVSEGNRGGRIDLSVANYTAAYAGLGLEDYTTFEATYSTKGFEDVRALMAENLLKATMLQEEAMIFGGNYDVALGITPQPVASKADTGGSIAAATYNVGCVALGYDAYRRTSLTAGVPVDLSKTNADGTVDTIPGGAAQRSTLHSVTTTTGTSVVRGTVTPVVGAVAYAWFVGTAGNEKLAAITTINSFEITALPAGGNAAWTTAPQADKSAQGAPFAFNGFLYTAFKSGSGATIVTQATGTPGAGTPLTADGAGGIAEIEAVFRTLWDTYKVSPKTLWVSSQELYNISKKVLTGGAAPLFRFNVDANGAMSGLTAGVAVGNYLNKITNELVKIVVHPNAVPGTILFESDSLPYPASGVSNVYQIKTRQEYYQLEWPLVKRRYETGVYVDELFQHYAPFTMAVLTNIGNG